MRIFTKTWNLELVKSCEVLSKLLLSNSFVLVEVLRETDRSAVVPHSGHWAAVAVCLLLLHGPHHH